MSPGTDRSDQLGRRVNRVASSKTTRPLCRARDFRVGEGEHSLRMQPVECADQLAPEYVQAVKGKTFPTAKVEPEFAPVRVGLARILAQAVEVRLPFGAAVSGADGFRQSGVEGVVGGDPEQLTRGIVDEVRQLLRFLARQQTAGLQTKLLLDLG